VTQRHYGCIPDTKDRRDYRFQVVEGIVLPTSVDLRPGCAPIEDQGQLGSCTSFATGAAIRFARKKQGLSDFVTSHLFLYYNSRTKNTKSVDSGASIRDAIIAAAKQGDCPESEWPYDISKFASKPPIQAYQDALKDRAITYLRVSQSLVQMKSCLAQGFPVVIGISVYESFESDEVAKTGIVPMPTSDEQLLGGHALLVVGYDTSKQWFIVRNSWGPSFGDQGYISIPFEYLGDSNLASDFWTIRTIGS
jgi:C1A family cysteine protease